MTRVLVGYASAYGSTKGVATRIGERLRAEGFEVDVRPLDEIDSVDTYDAAILGSAIHNQKWLPPAVDFMRTHTAALAGRPVWLFSVCSLGETTSFFSERMARPMRRRRKEPAIVSEVRPRIDSREHRYFAGAIERGHWTVVGNLFLRLLGGTFGDHRDWPDIERWATGIAMSLRAAAGSTQQA
jgi:menaquinone-dependent protoporphyrinogen oxidase